MEKNYVREKFMRVAINEAILGNKNFGKYPIGAAVFKGNRLIAKSANGLPNNLDPAAHAELLAIRKAAEKIGNRNLDGCVLYTTNEPCPMCAGAVVWANMSGVVFGADVKDLEKFWSKRRNEKTSTRRFVFYKCKEILGKARPKIIIKKGVLRKECLKLFNLYDPSLRR